VLCPAKSSSGSGFIHVSGRVVTAAHVVAGCAATEIVLLPADNKPVKVTAVVADAALDLALLTPEKQMGPGLQLRNGPLSIGLPVAAWGFPGGYPGLRPLLTMGHLAGEAPAQPNGPVRLWINGAFNSGNSGGPLVLAETGEVVGVVAAKLAPIPPIIEQALDVMSKQRSGVVYNVTNNGKTEHVSEAQVVAAVLQYLRGQTQLVIGMAVPGGGVAAFMQANNVTP
jgi:hypothetical protein